MATNNVLYSKSKFCCLLSFWMTWNNKNKKQKQIFSCRLAHPLTTVSDVPHIHTYINLGHQKPAKRTVQLKQQLGRIEIKHEAVYILHFVINWEQNHHGSCNFNEIFLVVMVKAFFRCLNDVIYLYVLVFVRRTRYLVCISFHSRLVSIFEFFFSPTNLKCVHIPVECSDVKKKNKKKNVGRRLSGASNLNGTFISCNTFSIIITFRCLTTVYFYILWRQVVMTGDAILIQLYVIGYTILESSHENTNQESVYTFQFEWTRSFPVK